MAIRHVISRGKVELGEHGEPQRLPGVVLDFTQQVKAEEKKRASEDRFGILVASLDEGFCVLQLLFADAGDPIDYRFEETKIAFERQSGLTNAVGKTIRELVPGIEGHWIATFGKVALTGSQFASSMKLFQWGAGPSARRDAWWNSYRVE